MPDMKDAMSGAGFRGPNVPPRPGGGPGAGGGGSGGGPFKRGYPEYFNKDGYVRVEMVMREAEELAARFKDDGLKRHQLRAFYDHAKRQLQRLSYGAPFEEVWPEVVRLKVCAADRVGRSANALPPSFKEFIDRNVDAVKDELSFRKGFMPHFEAVVGYTRIKD